jgi:hypothetical protein
MGRRQWQSKIMNKKNIQIRLETIEEQISRISERLYQPNISPSDAKKMQKRRNKLIKDKSKLHKKLQSDGLS